MSFLNKGNKGFTPLEMMIKNPKRRLPKGNLSLTGFTLIELLIAISIFAVVAVALYSAFFAGISVWRRSSRGGDVYQDIRFALDQMTKELKNTIYLSKDEESIFSFSGTTDELTFVTLEDTTSEEDLPIKEVVKVVYRCDKENNELIQMRAGKSLGFNIEKSEKDVLIKGVEEFKLEYCYDSGDEDEPYLWEEEWQDKEMKVPRGIKVSLLINIERQKEPLKFTKTIFVPIGVLGERELGL